MDSDDEWEEEEPGESLSNSEVLMIISWLSDLSQFLLSFLWVLTIISICVSDKNLTYFNLQFSDCLIQVHFSSSLV